MRLIGNINETHIVKREKYENRSPSSASLPSQLAEQNGETQPKFIRTTQNSLNKLAIIKYIILLLLLPCQNANLQLCIPNYKIERQFFFIC